jgi:hypothetical protein
MYQSFSKALPQVQWTRVEAWAGVGIPDVNGAASFGEFWIENKVCKNKDIQPLKLWRPSQIAWQTARSFRFRNVFNLVSRPRAGIIEIYSCDQLLKMVENQQLTDGSGNPDMNIFHVSPVLVLSAPVKWQLLIDHIEQTITDPKRSSQ